MKAITLYQPWASAIALGLKRFETRSWSTRYRGPILIHAGQRWTMGERVARRDAIEAVRRIAPEYVTQFAAHSAILGRIVAVADLVECRSTDEPGCTVDRWTEALPEIEAFFGDFSPGRWAWQLENAICLANPIPCRGAQGLWSPSREVIDQLPHATLRMEA